MHKIPIWLAHVQKEKGRWMLRRILQKALVTEQTYSTDIIYLWKCSDKRDLVNYYCLFRVMVPCQKCQSQWLSQLFNDINNSQEVKPSTIYCMLHSTEIYHPKPPCYSGNSTYLTPSGCLNWCWAVNFHYPQKVSVCTFSTFYNDR